MNRRAWSIVIPDDEEYFSIRVDQLEALASGGKNMAMEWVFFAGGAALGLVPYAGGVIIALANNKVVSLTDGGLAALSVGLAAYAIAKLMEARSTKTNVETLKNKIKAGQKLEIK